MLISRSMAFRFWAAALASVCTSGCIASSFPKTPAHGGPAWEEITTDHFIVDTDLEPSEAAQLVRDLENMRKVMVEVVFGGEREPKIKVRVLALRTDEFGHFSAEAVGFYLNRVLFQPILVTSPGGDWDTFTADIRKHELAHYVSSLFVDMELQPRWFAEGLASYLETVRYDEKTGTVEVGRHPPDYQYLKYAKPAFLDELWGWSRAEPYESMRARFYQSSWGILHYLFDERPDDLRDYERALANGDDPKKAWQQLFPDLDQHGLSEVLGKYLYRANFKVTKSTVRPAVFSMQRVPLSEADVLALRATLYMALQPKSRRSLEESRELARKNVAESLGYDPLNFWAHQVNYFYFDKLPDSAALARQVTARRRDNWLAWYWYADVLRTNKGPLDEQRSVLLKALELAPGNVMVLTDLAQVEGRAGNWPEALELSQKAIKAPPYLAESLVTYTAALSHAGKCDDALIVESKILQYFKEKIPPSVQQSLTENHDVCAALKPASR